MIKKIGKSVEHLLTIKKNFNRSSEYEKNKQDAATFLKNKEATIFVHECPSCGSDNLAKWSEVFGFSYQQCQTCDLVFLNPSPSPVSLEEFYSLGYEVSVDYEGSVFDKNISDFRVKNIIFPRWEFVKQFISPRSWLDLGAGNGETVYGLKMASANELLVTGVEINKNSIDFAQKNYGVDLCKSNLIDYLKTNQLDFDVVSLFGLLEHLALPTLEEITVLLSDKMKSGSFLVLLLPVACSYSSFFQKANNGLIARHLVPPLHITLWGEKSVNVFLAKTNFTLSGIWSYGQDCFELFYQLKEFLTADEQAKVLSSLPGIQKVIDEASLSDELLVVAKKN